MRSAAIRRAILAVLVGGLAACGSPTGPQDPPQQDQDPGKTTQSGSAPGGQPSGAG